MRSSRQYRFTRRGLIGSAAAFGVLGTVPAIWAQEQPPVIEPIGPEGETEQPIDPDDQTTGEIEAIAEGSTGEYFAETGHNISEPFLTPWRQAGGAEMLGLPLSESRFNPDTGTIEQFFEGIVLVNDPNLEAPWSIQGRQLGEDRITNVAPASARDIARGCVAENATCQFFSETGHTMSGPIAAFWNEGGGAPIFGFPQSEEFSAGDGRQQVFEKIILNVSSSGDVSAEPFGRDLMTELGLEGDPAFLPAPPTLGSSTLVTASEGLRLRSAPSTDSEIIAVLPDNAEFIAVAGANGAWIPGYADGYSGYVASEYLQAPERLESVAVGGEWDTSVWQGAALSETNIRAEPTTESRIIKTIQYGDPVIAVDWVEGETVDEGGSTWALLEDGTYIYERTVGRAGPVEPPPVPDGAPSEGKWIDCNLTQQLLVAYEGRTPVRVVVQTTGKPGWETPEGWFQINNRVANETMESGSIGAEEFYRLENVLFTQYFTDVGHALHFAWWKTRETIGRPGSHGCLNVLLEDAEYFWNWADIGTTVYSHY